jgi:hypothetical protein
MKCHDIIAQTAALCLLCSGILQAQPKGPHLARFSGNARLEMQYDGIEGKDQGRPQWIRTLILNPSFSFLGAPLQMPITLSTLESGLRQPFNRFNLHYSKNWFDLKILDTYPNFSLLSLSGSLVRGGSFDLQGGPFRLKLAGGETRRATLSLSGNHSSFRQNLYGGMIGIGKEEGRLFAHLALLYGKDRYDPRHTLKLQTQTGDTIEANMPRENMVVSLGGGLKLFKKSLSIKGEIAGSGLARDSRAAKSDLQGIPDFLDPKISSQYDLAYFVSAQYTKNSTRLEATFKQVGAAFVSFGLPYLQNDVQDVAVVFSHSLFKNQLLLDFNAQNVRDNVSSLKTSTTNTLTCSPGLGLILRNLPYLNLSYSVVLQGEGSVLPELNFQNQTNIVTMNAGYGFRLMQVTHSLNANYSFHRYLDKSWLTGGAANFDAVMYGVSATHRFTTPVSLNWGVLLTQNWRQAQPFNDIWVYRAGGSSRFFKNKLNSSVNFSLHRNRGAEISKQKLRFSFNSSYRLNNFVEIVMSVERNDYDDKISPGENYVENLARLFVSVKW